MVLIPTAAFSEPLKVETVMVPEEQIRLDFENGPKRFVFMVRRVGTAERAGIFD